MAGACEECDGNLSCGGTQASDHVLCRLHRPHVEHGGTLCRYVKVTIGIWLQHPSGTMDLNNYYNKHFCLKKSIENNFILWFNIDIFSVFRGYNLKHYVKKVSLEFLRIIVNKVHFFWETCMLPWLWSNFANKAHGSVLFQAYCSWLTHVKPLFYFRNVWSARPMGHLQHGHVAAPHGTLRCPNRPHESARPSRGLWETEHASDYTRGLRQKLHLWKGQLSVQGETFL